MTVRKLLGVLLISVCILPDIGFADPNVWLLVDTQKLSMEVKRGDKTLAVLQNIAIGRNGAGKKIIVATT